jgi:hypothetical protein
MEGVPGNAQQAGGFRLVALSVVPSLHHEFIYDALKINTFVGKNKGLNLLRKCVARAIMSSGRSVRKLRLSQETFTPANPLKSSYFKRNCPSVNQAVSFV